MVQFQDIPNPQDQRNQSQADIQNNFRYLLTLAGTASPQPGIIPVDHKATGNNVASPKDGFHNQVSFINAALPPTFPLVANTVNGEIPDSLLSSYIGTDAIPQLAILSSFNALQLTASQTPIAPANGGANIGGQSYFPSDFQLDRDIIVYFGQSIFTTGQNVTINLTPGFSGLPYAIIATPIRANTPAGVPQGIFVLSTSISATQFILSVESGSNVVNHSVYWIAIGPN